MYRQQRGSQQHGPSRPYIPPRPAVPNQPHPQGRGQSFSTPAINGAGPHQRTGANSAPLQKARTWHNNLHYNNAPTLAPSYPPRPQSGGPAYDAGWGTPPPQQFNNNTHPQQYNNSRPPQPQQYNQQSPQLPPPPLPPVQTAAVSDWDDWGDTPSQHAPAPAPTPTSAPAPTRPQPPTAPPHIAPPVRPPIITKPPSPVPAAQTDDDNWGGWNDQPSQARPADLATASSADLKRAALANSCPPLADTQFPPAPTPPTYQTYEELTARVDRQHRDKLAGIDDHEEQVRLDRQLNAQRDQEERQAQAGRAANKSPAMATKEKLFNSMGLGSPTSPVAIKGFGVRAGKSEATKEEPVAPVRRKAAMAASKAISPKQKKGKVKAKKFSDASDSEVDSRSDNSSSESRPTKGRPKAIKTPPKKLRTPQKKKQARSQPTASHVTDTETEKSPLVVKLNRLPRSSPEPDRFGSAPFELESSPCSDLVDLSFAVAQQRAKLDEKKAEVAKAKKAAQLKSGPLLLSSDEDAVGSTDEEVPLVKGRAKRPRPTSPTPEADPAAASTNLCPFCSKAMPTQLSDRLAELLAYLLKSPDVRPNPTIRNPQGMHLPLTQHRSFCAMHEDEKEHIPAGIKRGWPEKPDWAELEKRMSRDVLEYAWDVIMGKKGGKFYAMAKDEWERKGVNKMRNAANEMGTIGVEQPGYYGPKGAEIIRKAIYKYLIDHSFLTSQHTAPLDVDQYVRRVLIPECAVELIRQDLAAKRHQDPKDADTAEAREEAEVVCEESRRFGVALHSVSEEMDRFTEEMEAEEEKAREENEAEAKRERREEREREREVRKGKGKSHKGKEKAAVTVVESSKAPVSDEGTGRRVPLRRPKRALEREQAKAPGRDVEAAVETVDVSEDAEEGEVRPAKKARRVKAPAKGGGGLPSLWAE